MRSILSLPLLLAPVLALPTDSPHASKVSTVYQYPKGTWIENLVSTRNGSLLINLLGSLPAKLDIINPLSSAPPTTVHTFAAQDSLLGITELTPDVFAVAAGNYSTATGPTLGSFGLWKVDLSCKSGKVKVSKIASVGDYLINGLAAVSEHILLGADTFKGVVIGIDVRTGKYYEALNDESLLPTGEGPFKGGVNGLKVRDGYAYYTNSLHQTLSRVKVDTKTGKAIGPFTLVSDVAGPDDFALTQDGTAYVANVFENTITQVQRNGVAATVAGNVNSSAIAGPTSVTIGRGKKDRGVVYVGTSGAQAGPVNGTYTEGAKIVAVYV